MSYVIPEEVQKALHKADDAIVHARFNLGEGFLPVTANRACYSVYYCMTALLYTKEVFPNTHQGIHSKFSELFVKTGSR
jgi:uncharacterized protein (UPF0332 family)